MTSAYLTGRQESHPAHRARRPASSSSGPDEDLDQAEAYPFMTPAFGGCGVRRQPGAACRDIA